MNRTQFLETLRFRVAEVAIGPSSLRNQGAPGVIAAARAFLKGLDLASFSVTEPKLFLPRLDEATCALQKALPPEGRTWGGARKALNLFLRDALYCSDLAAHFRLDAVREWLEVPLDSYVAQGLRGYKPLASNLPRWKGVIHLCPEVSDLYQQVASAVTREELEARVDLDVIFYRAGTLRPVALT